MRDEDGEYESLAEAERERRSCRVQNKFPLI